MAASTAPQGARVFISYAHADQLYRDRLRSHLTVLEREGLVQAWDDREIPEGTGWAQEIDARLEAADVVLLLVSDAFIKSDYCFGTEMRRALARNADPNDRAAVIPIILRRCDWESSSFAKLQALPKDARPIGDWKNEDDYYTAVTKGLRQRIRGLRTPDQSWLRLAGQRLRDPHWWQQPTVWAMAGALLLAGMGIGAWWWRAAVQTDAEVTQALQALRSGRFADAALALEPLCRRVVARGACLALDKARLAAQLEDPESLRKDLERFAARADALKARVPNDPDLVLITAELTLSDTDRALRHPQALEDIARAIKLAGGEYPEAHFYLANMQMLAGQFAEALPLLNRAIDANPAAPAHYLNARAYARARTDDVAGAIEDYDRSAEKGLVLSRIEVAPLLWSRSEFERAADQLRAAAVAVKAPLVGRNGLPWMFETRKGKLVELRLPEEKQCLTHWMQRAGLALAQRRGEGTGGEQEGDCGPKATEIRAAVAAALQRAVRGGMDVQGRQRTVEFMRQYDVNDGQPRLGAVMEQ